MKHPEREETKVMWGTLFEGIAAAPTDGTLGLTPAEKERRRRNMEAIRQEHAVKPIGQSGLAETVSVEPVQVTGPQGRTDKVPAMPHYLEPYRVGLNPGQVSSDIQRIGAP